MSQIVMMVPPPENWQDFEKLTFSLCEAIWPFENPQRHGREGQQQQGVDVYSYLTSKHIWVGVQCKRRSNTAASGLLAGGVLKVSEIIDEVSKAEAFKPDLGLFIVATTASRDAKLEGEVRKLNDTRRGVGKFEVSVWFWDNYQANLNNHMHIMYRYYSDFLTQNSLYDADKHILSVLHLAFSRPAFNTYLHLENSCDDLLQAITDTQSAIKTGILKDRENGDVVRSAPSGANGLSKLEWRKSLASIEQQLSQVRDDYTLAISNGIVVQHGSYTEIKDHNTSEQLNRMRGVAIAELNKVLSEARLDPVESKLL